MVELDDLEEVKVVTCGRIINVVILGWEDPLEKEMASHSSTLAWKSPWTEEPGKLQSMGLQKEYQSVQLSHSVMSDSLQPHESQHTRPPCPSPTPGVHSNSRPSSW